MIKKLCLIFFAIMFFSGCASNVMVKLYDDNAVDSEFSTLIIGSEQWVVISLDGEPVDYPKKQRFAVFNFEISPGPHKVVFIEREDYDSLCSSHGGNYQFIIHTLDFDAEPKHQYGIIGTKWGFIGDYEGVSLEPVVGALLLGPVASGGSLLKSRNRALLKDYQGEQKAEASREKIKGHEFFARGYEEECKR